MTHQIRELTKDKRGQKEIIWGFVIFTHLALAALISFKSSQNAWQTAQLQKPICIERVALDPLSSQMNAHSSPADARKQMTSSPFLEKLAKSPSIKKTAATTTSQAVAPPFEQTSTTAPVKPAPPALQSTSKNRPILSKSAITDPSNRDEMRSPSAAKKDATPAVKQSAALKTRQDVATAAKRDGASAMRRNTPPHVDKRRAEAQKKALALISDIGQKSSSAPNEQIDNRFSNSEAGSFESKNAENHYEDQLIAFLQSDLQLGKVSEDVKIELLINDDGSYADHTIISCKNALFQHLVDCKFPQLSFQPPVGKKTPGPHSFILNLKSE